MDVIPVSNAEFKKLLKNGVIAELSVMDEINFGYLNKEDLSIYNEQWYATDELPLDYHCDLVCHAFDRSDGWSPTCNDAYYDIEVKSAKNGGQYTDWCTGKNTYFAECIQTGTNGYPEYLVKPPHYMVYVDIVEMKHYWYDGKQFAAEVKNRFHSKFPINRGTAEGIKFTFDDPRMGFIGVFEAGKDVDKIKELYAERLKERAAIKKQTVVHKKCDGLEDLV